MESVFVNLHCKMYHLINARLNAVEFARKCHDERHEVSRNKVYEQTTTSFYLVNIRLKRRGGYFWNRLTGLYYLLNITAVR